MKVNVIPDEWYPFWIIDKDELNNKWGKQIEMTEAELAEYELALAVLQNLFNEIEKRVESQYD